MLGPCSSSLTFRDWIKVESGKWKVEKGARGDRKELVMGRLHAQTLEQAEGLADRVPDVAETIERQRRLRRVVDQVTGSGTSVGANLYEADQALTAKDFMKTLGIVVKELSETKFWLRLIGRRGWVKSTRLALLL